MNFKGLEGFFVVVGIFYSMLILFVVLFKRNNLNKKLVYIMIDGVFFLIYLSKNVDILKEKKLIDSIIIIGNVFGGDYECINIYIVLIIVKEILKVDVVFVSMGFGIVGIGIKYGFIGIE